VLNITLAPVLRFTKFAEFLTDDHGGILSRGVRAGIGCLRVRGLQTAYFYSLLAVQLCTSCMWSILLI
jgi:hypothetical protein